MDSEKLNNTNSPQSRLKRFIKEEFKTTKAFAEAMGMIPSDVSKYTSENGSQFVTNEKIKKLSTLGLNIEWYQNGIEPMLLSDTNTEQTISLQAGHIVGKGNNYTINNKVSDNLVQDILNIKLYNVPAHANIGALVQFDDLAYSYKPIYVGLKLDPTKCIGLNVVGDSMIDSQITNGSIIIVETGSQINDGDRAVILHNGTMIVKYYRSCKTCEIDECPDCKYKFKLYSRNHGEHPYEISQNDDIIIVGKVKLVIQY